MPWNGTLPHSDGSGSGSHSHSGSSIPVYTLTGSENILDDSDTALGAGTYAIDTQAHMAELVQLDTSTGQYFPHPSGTGPINLNTNQDYAGILQVTPDGQFYMDDGPDVFISVEYSGSGWPPMIGGGDPAAPVSVLHSDTTDNSVSIGDSAAMSSTGMFTIMSDIAPDLPTVFGNLKGTLTLADVLTNWQSILDDASMPSSDFDLEIVLEEVMFMQGQPPMMMGMVAEYDIDSVNEYMAVDLADLNLSTEREAPFTVYNNNYQVQHDDSGHPLELDMHMSVQVGSTAYAESNVAVDVNGQNLYQVQVEVFDQSGVTQGVIDAYDHQGNPILAKETANGSSEYQIYDYFTPDLYFTNKTSDTEATFVVEIEGGGTASQSELDLILLDVVYDDTTDAYVEILIA